MAYDERVIDSINADNCTQPEQVQENHKNIACQGNQRAGLFCVPPFCDGMTRQPQEDDQTDPSPYHGKGGGWGEEIKGSPQKFTTP